VQLFNQISTDKKVWTQQNFIDGYYTRLQFVGGPYPPEYVCLTVSAFMRSQSNSACRTLSRTGRTSSPGRASAHLATSRTTTWRTGSSIRLPLREPPASASSVAKVFSFLLGLGSGSRVTLILNTHLRHEGHDLDHELWQVSYLCGTTTESRPCSSRVPRTPKA
jgi:hypothetical protein